MPPCGTDLNILYALLDKSVREPHGSRPDPQRATGRRAGPAPFTSAEVASSAVVARCDRRRRIVCFDVVRHRAKLEQCVPLPRQSERCTLGGNHEVCPASYGGDEATNRSGEPG